VEVRSNDFDVRRQINGGDNNEIRVSILGCWSENDGGIVSTATGPKRQPTSSKDKAVGKDDLNFESESDTTRHVPGNCEITV
jgi:hypothetical protein